MKSSLSLAALAAVVLGSSVSASAADPMMKKPGMNNAMMTPSEVTVQARGRRRPGRVGHRRAEPDDAAAQSSHPLRDGAPRRLGRAAALAHPQGRVRSNGPIAYPLHSVTEGKSSGVVQTTLAALMGAGARTNQRPQVGRGPGHDRLLREHPARAARRHVIRTGAWGCSAKGALPPASRRHPRMNLALSAAALGAALVLGATAQSPAPPAAAPRDAQDAVQVKLPRPKQFRRVRHRDALRRREGPDRAAAARRRRRRRTTRAHPQGHLR